MHFSSIISASTLLVAGVVAQSACTGQQYNDLPGFPASKSGCYPTTYYRTSDLGNTSPDDARSRCQQQCTADSQCSSVVAQVNKAADSNLYSGTCFFFTKGSDPAGPRRCADTAYLLLGYKKDSTNACFSSSSVAASSFCSSYLGIPVITKSSTTTPPTTTFTTTATSNPIVLTTNTATSTTTVTVTVSTTTTTYITAASPAKHKRIASTVPAPACVTSGTPATRLSAACSCLSVPTSTTTTTITAPSPSATVTVTTIIPITSTAMTTVTTTVTATSTFTRQATATLTRSLCIGNSGTTYTTCGNGGNCACEQTVDGHAHCVNQYGACGAQCSSSATCGTGQECLSGAITGCGYNSCSTSADVSTCGATFTVSSTSYSNKKRAIFVRGRSSRTWARTTSLNAMAAGEMEEKRDAVDAPVVYRHPMTAVNSTAGA